MSTETITSFAPASNIELSVPSYVNLESVPNSEYKNFIVKSAEFVFGQDRVYYENNVRLHIHFPEILMENEYGHEHTIKDLYVRTELCTQTNDGKTTVRLHGLYGKRMTVSAAEYDSNFAHSHLSGGIFSYTSFCRGDGSFGDYFAELQGAGIDPFDDTDFYKIEAFWHMLEGYVAWESRSGGPYTYMESVSRSSQSLGNPNRIHRSYPTSGSINTIVRNILEAMIYHNKALDYTFNYVSGAINVYLNVDCLSDERLYSLYRQWVYKKNSSGVLVEHHPHQEQTDSEQLRLMRVYYNSSISNRSSAMIWRDDRRIYKKVYDERTGEILFDGNETFDLEESSERQQVTESSVPLYPHPRVVAQIETLIKRIISQKISNEDKFEIERRLRHTRTEREARYTYRGISSDCSILY